jgi:hypothetical protein
MFRLTSLRHRLPRLHTAKIAATAGVTFLRSVRQAPRFSALSG